MGTYGVVYLVGLVCFLTLTGAVSESGKTHSEGEEDEFVIFGVFASILWPIVLFMAVVFTLVYCPVWLGKYIIERIKE